MSILKKAAGLVLAVMVVLSMSVVFAADEYPIEIQGLTAEENAVSAVNATVGETDGGTARALVGVYQDDALVDFAMSEPLAYTANTDAVFVISPAVSYTDGETVKAFVWSCDITGELTMIPLADSYTLGSASESVGASWTFDNITAGTSYESGESVYNENGDALVVTAAWNDTTLPTITERASGDNYLLFSDTTDTDGESGTTKQDSWSYTADAPLEGDVVIFSMDVNKSNITKDTILFRVYDSNNTTSDNSYASDGRSFELKTGDSGALAYVDYYSGTSDKQTQATISGFTYTASEWFSVRLEYDRTTNVVRVYAGDTADTCTLQTTYALGGIGTATKTDTIPTLSPTRVAMFTPGGGTVNLGVDNINVETDTYEVETVTVSGQVLTTYDDLKNKPEAFGGAAGAEITFTKVGETEAAASAKIGEDGSYTTELVNDAEYEVDITGIDSSYTVSDMSKSNLEISITDSSAEKNILLIETLGEVPYTDTLEVGPDKEYNTINKALSAVRKMNRSAGDTVTIVIDPGTYEEQLYIDVDDLVLKSSSETERPVVQWYYGIGYVYYSADPSTGTYNAEYAAAKTSKTTVSNWGSTIKALGDGFLAENIDFVNTFNKYITEAELEDGVEPGGDSQKDFARSSTSTEVRSKSATERAAAIYATGSEIELYRCGFYSSQDTFGTSANSLYVKECDIAGNTDYICGGNNVYFEECNLIWAGYSDKGYGGYLTACKTKNTPPSDLGYYFKDCTIMYSDEDGMKFANGSWGRAWGGLNCQVIFDNTTLADGVSKPTKWIHMGKDSSGNYIEVSEIGLYVINGVGGVDVSSNTDDNPHGTLTDVPAAEDYFGSWEPVHYSADTSKIKISCTNDGNGTVYCTVGGSTATRANEGDTVTVVTTPNTSYELETLTVTTASGATIELDADNSFTMPAEEVTVSATFSAKSMGIYSDWNLGQLDTSSTDAVMENVTWEGKDSLHVAYRNVYKTLDTAVTSGTATFETKVWIDPTDSSSLSGFRIYLENENASYWQDSSNTLSGVIAEVVNTGSGSFCYGPELKTTTSGYDFQNETAGWFTITITVDYSKQGTDSDFISLVVKNAADTEVLSQTMSAISGVDTSLKQIRLIDRTNHPYFADITFEVTD